jgi:hypothetical protein
MKKVVLILASVLVGLSAYAQGTVAFQNRDTANGVNAPIYDLTVGGTLLSGTGYMAQLYTAKVGLPEAAMKATGAAVDFRTGAAAGFVNVGSAASRAIDGVNFGEQAQVQIRAWSAAGGPTYEAAAAKAMNDPSIHVGKSATLTITTAASALNTPSPLTGLTPFAITPGSEGPIPEPSTLALAALGAAALLIRRRQ